MITDKRLVYTDDSGRTCIVCPSEEWHGTAEELAIHIGINSYALKYASDIPTDRTFRNAWKADLSVDMVKARIILRDKMRIARAPLLADLDTQYMRADEANNAQQKAAITQQKQTLRDITALPAIDAASTPEQLKAAWPTNLLGDL